MELWCLGAREGSQGREKGLLSSNYEMLTFQHDYEQFVLEVDIIRKSLPDGSHLSNRAMHNRARMHPRTIVRLGVERGEGGEVMALKEGGKATAGCVEVGKPEGADGPCASGAVQPSSSPPRLPAPDTSVAVHTHNEHISCSPLCEQPAEGLIVRYMLSMGWPEVGA